MKLFQILESDNLNALDHIVSACDALSDQVKTCHWNVKGPSFSPLHKDFGDLYDYLIDTVDKFAERLKAKNIDAMVSVKNKLPSEPVSGEVANINLVITGLENLIHLLDTSDLDRVSRNMADDVQAELEKWLWKFKSSLGSGENKLEAPKVEFKPELPHEEIGD